MHSNTHSRLLVTLLIVCTAFFSSCQSGASSLDSNLNLDEADIQQLQAAMAAGELTATRITQHYLSRIAAFNPALRAIIEVNPDALEIAATLDLERSQGLVRSPLHGIPVLIKDNIDTADRMQTSAGSLALLEAPTPAEDAFLVQRLRESGAIILGKSNLSEWANFRSSSSSSGWSARGGQTINPYVPERSPCGSSSGSAVGVAANLTVLAIGTETNGSIICPASHNNIVGLKPTLGLISRVGIIPIAHSQDTAGPMTRSVRDAVLLLNVLVAADPEDYITTNLRTRNPLDYTRYLRTDSLRGKRIGVMRQDLRQHPALGALMEAQFQLLRDAGAELLDLSISQTRRFAQAQARILHYEFKNDLENYLYERGGPYQTLEDLIRFNTENADREMQYFGQEHFLLAQETGGLGDSEYISALGFIRAYSQSSIDSILRDMELDALVAPSNSVGWLVDPRGDDTSAYVSNSTLAATAGYPNITVPAGFIDGFPIGLSFMGTRYSEPTLIGIAYAYEQLTKVRKAPALRAR
jgi:amidase